MLKRVVPTGDLPLADAGRTPRAELACPNLMERLALDEQHCIEEIVEPFVGRSLRIWSAQELPGQRAGGWTTKQLMVNPASHVLEGHLLQMGLVDDLQRLPKI